MTAAFIPSNHCRSIHHSLRWSAYASCVLLLSACATPPSDDAMPSRKPIAYYTSTQAFSAPVAAWPNQAWWKNYGDPQLDALIDAALADAPTIAVASARLRRALASTQVANAALQPQVNANTSVTQQKQSYNYLTPPNATPQDWNDYGRATLDFSWELDVWGKNHAALASATSEAEAARADMAQAQLTLATAIASAYAEFARQYAALDVAQSALTVRIKTAELFQQRQQLGLETKGSVRQVEARRAAAEFDVLSLQEKLDLQRNYIAALVGAGPDRGLTLTRPLIAREHAFGLPDQLAAELLGRRPDITAARLRAEAAAARIEQARAVFYPNINLNALIGVQSLGIDALTKNGSSIGSVGPAISLPIFNGGRLRGQLRGAEAEYAEAVANYEKTLTQALQDVADAAVSQKALGPQLSKTNAAVDAARDAWEIQHNRYQGGLASYLDVLSAEDYLLTNLRTQADLRARSFSLDVALVHALGGGYATTLK